MRLPHLSRLGCLLVTLIVADVADAAVGPPAVRFDRDVAPLLIRRCLDCHRGTAPEGGLDLTRFASARGTLGKGKLARSRLWQHIRDDEMPPGKPLPDAEKAVLRAWIASGPSWGTDPIDPYRLTTDNRGGFDWWSLQSIRRATPPAVARTAWVRNPIDRFVLAKLEARRLAAGLLRRHVRRRPQDRPAGRQMHIIGAG